jgi:hypothetical protein
MRDVSRGRLVDDGVAFLKIPSFTFSIRYSRPRVLARVSISDPLASAAEFALTNPGRAGNSYRGVVSE